MTLAAILFSDIKGSSNLSHKESMQYKKLVEPHILTQVYKSVAEYRGDSNKETLIKYFNSWGDAYLFVFDNPFFALEAALKLRDEFKKDWTSSGYPVNSLNNNLKIRCSLHAGDIELIETKSQGIGKRVDILGSDVVISARIEPVTPPGRIWATERFKDLFLGKEIPQQVKFIELGEKILAKKWGSLNLFDVSRTDDSEHKDTPPGRRTDYLSVKVSKKRGVYSFSTKGEIVYKDSKMPLDEWSSKIRQMEDMLANGEDEKDYSIDSIGLAVGVQNFIYFQNERLLAGVRYKSSVDAYASNFTLTKDCFNTGFQLQRKQNHFDKLRAYEFDDLFKEVDTAIHKEDVRTGHIDDLIRKKAGKHRCSVKFGNRRFTGVIFINRSKIFPRFELGICKYFKIESMNEYRSYFGVDKFGQTDENNPWIWVEDGEIILRSLKDYKDIPSFSKRQKLEGEKYILIENDLKKYGFKEKYVPLVSDEFLEGNDRLVGAAFSSPARSLLELF